MKFDWATDWPVFVGAIGETLWIVALALGIGGLIGLLIGLTLFSTRPGGIGENKFVYTALNVLVNFVRPIPFIIFLAAAQPITKLIVNTTIGNEAFVVPAVIMCAFATSRIVEQNLVAIDPGVIEAARSMGASPLRILRTVVVPEALGPLVLGYAFLFVAVTDMSALAGTIGGGGLGNFALVYGYQRFDSVATWITVVTIVVIVQVVQFLANALARKIMRR
ncbi:MAG: ABC transporter permease subunit [Actinomycetaceae bacterium]|nr:ABC transporter permease subunit [Arcanobacterium sp.]MDD7504892.1 ABC transporter permease subunit [Actinomycetaceae bacterium]MDY6142728.1 ABC transporter permease subunit [Arcanobacterium sp.]